MAYIYVLKNKINNKLYIGQTVQNINKRFDEYKNNRGNRIIHKAIKKYGWDNFEKHVFQTPEKLLDYFEVEMIKSLNSLVPTGYNITTGGNKNKHLSEDLKKHLSIVLKGKKAWNKNKKFPEFSGAKSFLSKKIVCLETGEIFDCIKDASEKYNINRSNISMCCTDKHNTAGGYHWAYYTESMQLPTKEDLEERIQREKKESFLNKSNSRKGKKFPERSGKNHFASKKVICYELNEIYDSISEASIKSKADISAIIRCCNNKQHTAQGYHWAYYKEGMRLLTENELGENKDFKLKKIICIETNEIFNSIKEAVIKINRVNGTITTALKNKNRTAGGFHWMYYEDYLNKQQNSEVA